MDSDEERVMSRASTSSRASTEVKRPKKKKKSEDPAVAQLRQQLEDEREDFQIQMEALRKELAESNTNVIIARVDAEHHKSMSRTWEDSKNTHSYLHNTKQKEVESLKEEVKKLKQELSTRVEPVTPTPDETNQLNTKISALLAENALLRKDLAAALAARENPPAQDARENPAPGENLIKSRQGAATPSAPVPRKRPRDLIPAVVLHNTEEWTQVKAKLTEKQIKVRKAKLTRDGIAIMPETTDDHRKLTSQLTENSKTYHTYALEDERLLRAVFRGLPLCIDTEEIKLDLQEKGFNPSKVSRMIHPRTKQPMPLVLVQVPPKEDAIFQVKTCCQLTIRTERQRPRTQPGQCHNCQGFGHAQNRCSAPPKCVKCGGDHASRSCEKPREEPARCLHCSGPHPASYRGCPKAPRRSSRPTPPTTEAPAAPVRQVPPYRKPHVSYAEAARPKQADVSVGPPQQTSHVSNRQPAHPQQWESLREQFEAMKQLFDRYFSMFQIPQQEAMDQDLANTTTTQLS